MRAGRSARCWRTPAAASSSYPGELFGTGTLPGGSGIEHGRLLERGDTIALAIDGIGTLSNRIDLEAA